MYFLLRRTANGLYHLCHKLWDSWQTWISEPRTYAGWETHGLWWVYSEEVRSIPQIVNMTQYQSYTTASPRLVIQFKPCPVQLSFKVAEEDKLTMAKSLQARRPNDMDRTLPLPSISDGGIGAALPPLKYLPEDEDGWTTFEEPILYVYAGKGPYVGRYGVH